jgi:hypothetical protein
MPKSTIEYWNPLIQVNKKLWKPIPGLEEIVEELTLSIDTETGEYTRLNRFHPGADTTAFSAKVMSILKKFSLSAVGNELVPVYIFDLCKQKVYFEVTTLNLLRKKKNKVHPANLRPVLFEQAINL